MQICNFQSMKVLPVSSQFARKTGERRQLSLHRHRLLSIRASSEDKQVEDNLVAAQKSIKDRINRAKAYRNTKGSPEGLASGSRPESLSADRQSGATKLDGYNARLAQYGAEIGEGQAEALQTALSNLKEPVHDDHPNERGKEESLLQQQTAMESSSTPNRVPPSLHAKLKTYVESAQADTFSSSRDCREGPPQPPSIEAIERQQAAVSGDDEEAASYLQQVSQTDVSEAANLRPEMFTALKEEQAKARGVEFITKDKTYNPLEQPQDPAAYKPKVSTWGMFPRPQDISKAYGGGRTFRPGEALESADQAQERKDRVSAAILEYRRKQGLFIDPGEEAKWSAALAAGIELLQSGHLSAAVGCFDDILRVVPPRSRLGGEAQLQRAICLDSAGRNDEAYKLYMTLERHPSALVQKQAKRMLFGFRAAENLKASTMSYAVGAKGNKDWDKYFTKLSGQWNSGFVDSGPEDQTLTNLLATAVILLPLLCLAAVVLHPKF